MRALQLQSYDGPGALRVADIPAPRLDGSTDTAIVKVMAIGINFPDLLATKGGYQHKPELPFTPGCEIAGVVQAAAPGSSRQPGDRVAAFVWDGGFADEVEVPIEALVPIPDGTEFGTAAAMIVNYHTVHFALHRRGRMNSGETLLVLGAGGGIGTAAVQVGKALGGRVLAGVANEGQRVTAEEAGADEVLVLSEGFSSVVREMTGSAGVDLVLDPLGDWLFLEGTRALAPEGRILVVGFAAGEIPTLRVNRLLLKNISAVGVGWGAFLGHDPSIVSEAGALLERMLVSGVRPVVGARYEFEQIPDALQALERGEIAGKAVVELDR
jgi:NADPH2:quinone reductase